MRRGFVGREEELRALRSEARPGHAQLVVVHGRRRVGKTALVEKAFRGRIVWRFDGLEGVDNRTQLEHFHAQLALHVDDPGPRPTSWEMAFRQLSEALGNAVPPPAVVFFDEFQWLVGLRGNVVSVFKSYWDQYNSKHAGLKWVLCGSVSSFLVRKVIRSRALYGRVSLEIHLKPFTVTECRAFFGDECSPRDVLEIAMCFGGVPSYLEVLNPEWSLHQNLNELALSPTGFFFGEYERIFISHFGRNPAYEKIVDSVGAGPRTADQLARSCGTQTGGTFSGMLRDLELAGFIEGYTPLDKSARSRLVRYRILDEFLHFHSRFIQPNRREIVSGQLRAQEVLAGPAFRQWQGCAFERLCRRNAALIADHLRFSGIRYKAGSWFTGRPATESKDIPRGAQVDLMFERADRMLTIVEAKYTQKLQARRLVEELEARCAAVARRYPNHGIQRVLIVGRDTEVPVTARRAFDVVVHASELF